MRFAGLLGCVVTVGLVSLGGAEARAATVAGPLAGGATLTVTDRGTDLCVTVGARTDHGTVLRTGGCGPPPESARQVDIAQTDGPVPAFSAVVPAAVASVELLFTDGTSLRADTVPGPGYAGRYAGALRFLLVETPKRRVLRLARWLDAAGHELAATEPAAANGIDGTPAPGEVIFARGRLGAGSWRAATSTTHPLAPTPTDPEHRVTRRCVLLRLGSGGGAATCPSPGEVRERGLVAVPATDCDGTGVAGLAAAGTRRVVVVRGDGSRFPVATRALPARLGGGAIVGFALSVGGDVTLRRVVGVDARGRSMGTVTLGAGPAAAACGPATSSGATLGVYASQDEQGPAPAPIAAGERALVAADDGGLLCVDVGRLDPRHGDCALPPLDGSDIVARWSAGAGRTVVGGVAPPGVTAIRVGLDGGATRTIPTTATGPYHGRWAADVRFFSLTLPAGRMVRSAVALGGLAPVPVTVLGPVPPVSALPVLLRAGGVSVRSDGRCLFVSGASACHAAIAGLVSATVSCAGRRPLLVGLTAAGTRAVVGVLAGGRRLRAALSPPSGARHERAFLLRLGSGDRLRRVVETGHATRRARLALPAARDQCGYAAASSVGGPSQRPHTAVPLG